MGFMCKLRKSLLHQVKITVIFMALWYRYTRVLDEVTGYR